MRPLIGIAARLAFSAKPEQRWRQVAVVVTTAAGVLCVLLALSAFKVLWSEADIDASRGIVPRSAGDGSGLRVVMRKDEWRDKSIHVAWLDPIGPEGKAPLPPGLDALPEPGSVIVSPGLQALAEANPEDLSRYPADSRVLHSSVVTSPEELIAYARPATGVRLSDEIEISGFGGPQAGASLFPTVEPKPMGIVAACLGVFALLPALAVAVSGAAVRGPLRDRRMVTLTWLGVSNRRVWGLAVLETLFLVVPTTIVVVTVWHVAATRLTEIPLVGRPVFQGDLILPEWSSGLVALGWPVLIAGLTTLLSRYRHSRGPRPTSAGASSTSRWRWAPMVVGLALVLLAPFFRGVYGLQLVAGGLVLAMVGVLMVTPWVLRFVGTVAWKRSSLGSQLAGRRLQRDSGGVARPLIGLAAAVALLLAGTTFFSLISGYGDSDRQRADVSGFMVRSPEVPGDVARVVGPALPAEAAVLDVAELSDGSGLMMSFGEECGDLLTLFGLAAGGGRCAEEQELKGRLSDLLGMSPAQVQPATSIPDERVEEHWALVVVPSGPHGNDVVRNAAADVLAVPLVLDLAPDVLRPSPDLLSWNFGGLALLGLGALCCVVVGIVDRFLFIRRNTGVLVAIGLTPAQVAGLEARQFLAAFAVTVGTGAFVGIVASVALTASGPGGSPPFGSLFTVTGGALMIGLLAAGGLRLFGSRVSHADRA